MGAAEATDAGSRWLLMNPAHEIVPWNAAGESMMVIDVDAKRCANRMRCRHCIRVEVEVRRSGTVVSTDIEPR